MFKDMSFGVRPSQEMHRENFDMSVPMKFAARAMAGTVIDIRLT